MTTYISLFIVVFFHGLILIKKGTYNDAMAAPSPRTDLEHALDDDQRREGI
jgi:hypothetical protein